MHRYGPSLSFLGQGHGYDTGGIFPDGTFGWNTSGENERVLTGRQNEAFESLVGIAQDLVQMSSGPGVHRPTPPSSATTPGGPVHITTTAPDVRVFIGDQELTDLVRVEIGETLGPLSAMAKQGRIFA
jgi:hypothetical protein